MDTDLAALTIAATALIVSVFSLYYYVRQLRREQRIRTLEYVSGQFDRLSALGARDELRKMGKTQVLTYVDADPSTSKTQRVLEYVYTFNRIAVGLKTGSLSEDVLFSVWPPSWFRAHWDRFEPLVKRERSPGRNLFGSPFEWLALKKCPEVRTKYQAAGEATAD